MATTGQRRDLVNLMALSTRDDERWGPAGTWTQYDQVWAQVMPLSGTQEGNEEVVNQGVQSLVNYFVNIRYRTDVSPQDRIIYRGQTLEILSAADPDGKRKELAITARQFNGVS